MSAVHFRWHPPTPQREQIVDRIGAILWLSLTSYVSGALHIDDDAAISSRTDFAPFKCLLSTIPGKECLKSTLSHPIRAPKASNIETNRQSFPYQLLPMFTSRMNRHGSVAATANVPMKHSLFRTALFSLLSIVVHLFSSKDTSTTQFLRWCKLT
jgi:hypothetical protein